MPLNAPKCPLELFPSPRAEARRWRRTSADHALIKRRVSIAPRVPPQIRQWKMQDCQCTVILPRSRERDDVLLPLITVAVITGAGRRALAQRHEEEAYGWYADGEKRSHDVKGPVDFSR